MPLLLIIILFVFIIDGNDNKSHNPERVKPKAVDAYEMKIPRHYGGVTGGWYNSTCVGNEYGCNKGGF